MRKKTLKTFGIKFRWDLELYAERIKRHPYCGEWSVWNWYAEESERDTEYIKLRAMKSRTKKEFKKVTRSKQPYKAK